MKRINSRGSKGSPGGLGNRIGGRKAEVPEGWKREGQQRELRTKGKEKQEREGEGQHTLNLAVWVLVLPSLGLQV